MKKLFLISLAVLFVMGLAVSSDAVVKKKGMGKGAGMASCDGDCGCSPMEKLKDLGLDEKQKEAVQTIHFRTKKEMVRNRADVQVAEIELKEVLSKDPVDLKAAEAAVKKIETLKSEKRMLHIKTMEEIKANLTPEQKKKFVSTMDMDGMGHGKGMKGKCNKHCMDKMEGMGPMGHDHGQHHGGTPPAQHKHD